MQPINDPNYLNRLNNEFNPKVQLPSKFLLRLDQLKVDFFKHCWKQFANVGFDKLKLKELARFSTDEYLSLSEKFTNFIGFHRAVLQFIEEEVKLYRPLNSQLNECVPYTLCLPTIQERLKVIDKETLSEFEQRVNGIKNEVFREFKYGERFLTAQSMPFICNFFQSLTPTERKYHIRTPSRSTKNSNEAALG